MRYSTELAAAREAEAGEGEAEKRERSRFGDRSQYRIHVCVIYKPEVITAVRLRI